MKIKSLLLAATFWTAASALVASEPQAMLLKAKSITVKDHVVVALEATVIMGEVQMSAAEITLDKDRELLKCVGATTIRSNGVTITAQSVTIEVKEKKVFMLSSSGVVIGPEGPANFDFTQKISQPRQ